MGIEGSFTILSFSFSFFVCLAIPLMAVNLNGILFLNINAVNLTEISFIKINPVNSSGNLLMNIIIRSCLSTLKTDVSGNYLF